MSDPTLPGDERVRFTARARAIDAAIAAGMPMLDAYRADRLLNADPPRWSRDV